SGRRGEQLCRPGRAGPAQPRRPAGDGRRPAPLLAGRAADRSRDRIPRGRGDGGAGPAGAARIRGHGGGTGPARPRHLVNRSGRAVIGETVPMSTNHGPGSSEEGQEALLEAFVDHLRLERGRSEHTVRAYRREAARLFEHLRDVERIAIAELDVTALRSWLGARAESGASTATLARSAAAARTVTSWLAATGRIPHDVGGRLRTPRRGRHLPAVLSGDQAGALLDGMGERADGGPRSPAPRSAA